MALTTLAKLKQYGNITEVESDTLLLRMIDSASASIETYCSRTFLSASHAEVRDGNGNKRMGLRHFPVTAIASVTINGQVIPPRPSPLSNGYTFDDLTVRLTGYTFEEGIDNVEVVYTAGLNAIPNDVDLACCEVVMLRYKSRDRMGVSSKSLAGETISYTNDDFPDYVTRVLDQYRMVALP
jgi:hypothetical protein